METYATARAATCRHIGVHLAWVNLSEGYSCRACMAAGGATEAEITRRFRNPLGVRPAARDPLVGGKGHPR